MFLLAVGVLCTWFLDGLIVPRRVVGDSMAGALLGMHRDVVCDDCGYPYACGTDVRPTAAYAVCPNCGYAANDLESRPDIPGQRVLIDRAAFSIRAPRRWEIVAFRRSSRADEILVKRVAGLPGESIEIHGGDVYANGQVQRKSLTQQRALAIPVHRAGFRSTRRPARPPRWRTEPSDARWNAVGGQFTHAAHPSRQQVDWLAYHHWRRLATGDRVCEGPITDLCGYNASQPRRKEDEHAVTDLMLSFRLGSVTGRGTFLVRMADGCHGFEAHLEFSGNESPTQYSVACLQGAAEQPVTGYTVDGQAVANGEVSPVEGERLLEFSLIDQQFLLAVDGRTIVVYPYERREWSTEPPSCPLAIGAKGIDVVVDDLRVLRDVYYTHPIGVPTDGRDGRPIHLSPGAYYVLGDNSPVSEDSRTWPDGGAVEAKLLVGKPLVAIPSVWLTFGGRWHFQVPNPAGIRYIR